MTFELDAADVELLRRILERHLSELRAEIGSTENYSWRQDMHADEDRIKAMLGRLRLPAGA